MAKLSTVIMCFNEEDKIAKCIQSAIGISDEVLILDSYSTDSTVNIAEELGARVEFHKFMGYIKQRELSISMAKNDWVLALDADEFLSEALANEIKEVIENPNVDAYNINRLNSINKVFMHHGPWFPNRILRLFNKKKVYCGGNPPHDRICPIDSAKVKNLKSVLFHHSDENLQDRINTINNHSSQAAKHRFSQGKKSNYLKLFIKPLWKFINGYFLKLGMLDGFYGFQIAITSAQYVFFRESKIIELWKYENPKE